MTHYSGITELITFCRTLIIIIGICRRSSRQSVHSYNKVITSTPQFHPSFLHSHDVQLYQNNKSFTSIDNMIITHNINKSIPSDMPRTIPYPGPTLYQVQEHNLSFYLNFPSLWHKVNLIPHVVTHMHNAMIAAIIIPFNLSFYFFVVSFPFLELNFLWFVICGAFYCVKCNVEKSTPPTFHCLLWFIGQRQWGHSEFNGKTNDFNVQFLFLCHSLNPISDKLSSTALCHFLYPLVLWCTFSRTHVVLT